MRGSTGKNERAELRRLKLSTPLDVPIVLILVADRGANWETKKRVLPGSRGLD